MKIGIPRALFYHTCRTLHSAFFNALGVSVVLSPETNQQLLAEGINLSIDECCLPVKIYMGHVNWLVGKCDCIFVPRIENFGKSDVACVKFFAMHDIVVNTFPNEKIIGFNIDAAHGFTEEKAFIDLGSQLGFTKAQSRRAYKQALKAQADDVARREEIISKQLESKELKILVVSHAYNIADAFIGVPIIKVLKQLGAEVLIPSEIAYEKFAVSAKAYSEKFYWKYNKELVGAMAHLADKVDGIVLITAFPCGPDSLVNELVIKKQKTVPMINLCVDELQAQSGIETRIESFIDILKSPVETAKRRVK